MAATQSEIISNEIVKFERANHGNLNVQFKSNFNSDHELVNEKVIVTFPRVPLQLFACAEGRDAIYQKAHEMALEVIGRELKINEDHFVGSWITFDPVHPELVLEAPIVR